MVYKNDIKKDLVLILDELGMYVKPTSQEELIEMDSLQFICFIIEIENKFKIEVEDEFYSYNGKSTLDNYVDYIVCKKRVD